MESNIDHEINIQKQLIINDVLNIEDNKYCADCKNNKPICISINLGVLVCEKCAVFHMNLGKKISLLKSRKRPEDFPIEILKIIIKINNKIANNYWEYNLNKFAPNEIRIIRIMEFIKNKYLFKKWAKPNEIDPMTKIINENNIKLYDYYNLDEIYNDEEKAILIKFNKENFFLFYKPNSNRNNKNCLNESNSFFQKNNKLDMINLSFNGKKQEQKQEEILLKLMQKDMKDELEKRSINTEINIKNERIMEKRENMKTKILKKPRKLTQIIKNKKRLEKRKIEIEKKEKEILERERLERERIEKERLERERLERERFEKLERLERIMRERERLEREKAKIEKERKELIKEINNKYDYVKDDLPVPFFIDENKLEKLKNSNNERCLICLDNFIIKNQVLYLPCSHLFHSFCIMRWLLQNNKCPICLVDYRGDIEEKEDNEDIGRYYEELFNDISMMEDIRLFNYNNILERNNNFFINGNSTYRPRGRGVWYGNNNYRGRGRGSWNNRGYGRGYWRGRSIFRGNGGNNYYERGNFRGQRGFQRGRGIIYNRPHLGIER